MEAVRSPGVEEVPYVLLTHGHFDHAYFASEASGRLKAKALIHSADFNLMRSAGLWGAAL